jgi:hypothetical protein
MPLRAVVDGREVQVWDLDGGEWADLRRRGRAGMGAGAVAMACCGAPGLAKASRNGNPFFAHRPTTRGPAGVAAPPCRWAGESAAHALCKLLAAAGARRAGWAVRTEAAAPDGGWRADVLCASGAARVAIEVQLARAAPGEMAARQERYRAAGVRGAWLVPADRCPPPCRGLPAFPLEVAGGAARVGLGVGASAAPGVTLPLDGFVAGLLRGRVRFEEARVVRPLGCPVAVTAPDACRRCGRTFEHVAGVTNLAAAIRPRYRVGGDAVPVTALRDLWDADRERAWSVEAAVRRLRRQDPALSPLSPLAPRRCPVAGEAYLTALCPACGAAQGDGAATGRVHDQLRQLLIDDRAGRFPFCATGDERHDQGFGIMLHGLEDPRETRRCNHQLVDILVIAACAVIACAESWEDIELYGRSKQAWLETFLALPNGIPSHDTFRRVFMLIDPGAFEACFSRWAQSLAVGVEREVVAVDGKAVRRSGSRRHDHGPLHLVSAWASEQGLALGQRAVDGKSNEITAIPELLDTLRLEGCIVTLDAMGCQKEIAERIRARGADYLLVLKANHGRAFEAVREHFERTCFGLGSGGRPVFDAFEEGHGRLVRRRAFMDPAAKDLEPLRGWPELSTGAGGGDDPRRHRHRQGRGRDPLLPHQLRRRSRRPGPGRPPALERRERAALGARRHLPRGRQPGARPHRRAQPRPPAQDRPQPRRQGSQRSNQPTRAAQEGRLERRLYAPDHRQPSSCVNPGP